MRTLALAVSLLSTAALAAGIQVPYQGRLDKAGHPQNGAFDLQFSLYDASAGGNLLWTDTFSAVPVVNGAFSVKLGAGGTLDSTVFRSPQVFVAVAVQGPGDTSFTTLAGRQQLLTTPYAAMSQGDFSVPGKLSVGPDAGVPAVTLGGTSPLKLQSGTSQLTADGQSVDSNGALGLQSHSLLATNVGGALNVGGVLTSTGPVVAPNVGVKVYDSGSDIVLGSIDFQIHPNTTRSYLVYIDGYTANATSGDTHLLMRFNSQTSGYRSFLTWNGETNGYFFESSGVALGFNAESALVFYNAQAVISSRGANPPAQRGFTVQATASQILPGNGHVFYDQSGGGIMNACNDPCTVSIQASIASYWLAHVVVYAVPN